MTHAALEASYALCQRKARRSGSNFYWTFYTLPREKRRAMFALYAFLRETDDLGDEPGDAPTRRTALEQWRIRWRDALAGSSAHPLLPALVDVVRRFAIPTEYFEATIDGVLHDQTGRTPATIDDLAAYCYQVAGAVGLSCIHIWGFQPPLDAIRPLAVACGEAFQLTNILRDVAEDARAGRVYLPSDELARFDVSIGQLQYGPFDDRLRALMQFQMARAAERFTRAERLVHALDADGRAVFRAMFNTYRTLLSAIEARHGNVWSRRVRLSFLRKVTIAAGAWLSTRR